MDQMSEEDYIKYQMEEFRKLEEKEAKEKKKEGEKKEGEKEESMADKFISFFKKKFKDWFRL